MSNGINGEPTKAFQLPVRRAFLKISDEIERPFIEIAFRKIFALSQDEYVPVKPTKAF